MLCSNFVYSQSIITTDPKGPINTERPELANHFNWEERNFSVYHPDGHFNNGNNAIDIGNPYYKREIYQRHFNLYDYETTLTEQQETLSLNFDPKDGWELLYKNNGIDPWGNLITDPLKNRIGPYFMFYNKYTGTLRVIAAFDGLGANDKVETTLRFRNISDLNVSALLNFYGKTAQPLDQKTDVTEIAQTSGFASNRGFVSADFQLSYDPCNCNKKSEIETDFSLVNNADLKLSGRLIATSVPLDASGNSPLLNREDFLTAVYKDGFDVKGGALTYSNINKLVAKYKNPITDPLEAAAIDVFKAALIGGASNVDKEVIGPGAAIVFNSAFKDLPFYKVQKSVGLGIVGAGANALSAELFPEHKVPNISFIEGEMALSGTLTDNTPLNNGSNIIVEPGSLNSSTASWQYYPLYNKPLGLFALLQMPTVIRSTRIQSFSYKSNGCSHDPSNVAPSYGNGIYKFHIYKFNGTFKYAFNSDANINVSNTKIYAALVLTAKNPLGTELIKNLQLVETLNSIGDEQKVYITPFVPVEYLDRITPEILFMVSKTPPNCPSYKEECPVDVKLRLMIEYEFNANSYGKRYKTLQVYTYPVNIVDGEDANTDFQDITSMQMDYATSQDLINPQPYHATIGAWNKIEISHTLGAILSNGSITFKANQIVVKPGAVLKRGTVLKLGLPYEDHSRIMPVTGNELSTYCTNNYQAYLRNATSSNSSKNIESNNLDTVNKNIADSVKEIMNDVNDLSNLQKNEVEVYPNPSDGSFNIMNINGFSKIIVTDIGGVVLYSSVIDTNTCSLQLNIGRYVKSGLILVKLTGNNSVVVKKIIIK